MSTPLASIDLVAARIGGARVQQLADATDADRVAALLVQMPVLESATPAAASLFVPLLLAVRLGGRVFGFATSLIRRLPRTGIDPLDIVVHGLCTVADERFEGRHGEVGSVRRLVLSESSLRERDARKRADLTDAVREAFRNPSNKGV